METMTCSDPRRSSRRRSRLAWIALSAVVPVVVASCSSSGTSSAGGNGTNPSPFRIAVPADETGTDSAFGLEMLAGIRAAAAYLNKHGGISGRQIQLTVQDTKTDPATAVSEAQNMLSGSHYDVMFPATGAINGLESSLAKVATSNKILEVNAGGDPTVTDPETFPTTFATSSAPTAAGGALSCMLKTQLKATTVAVIHHDEPYSDAEVAGLKASGLNVVADKKVTETEQDFTATIQQVQAVHPDVLVIEVFGPQVGAIFDNLRAVKYSGKVAGGNEIASQEPLQVVPKLSLIPAGMMVTASAGNMRVNGNFSPLQQALINHLGSHITGLLGNRAIGWDGLQLIKYAYENSPSTSTDDLVKTLEGLNGTKAIGTLSVAKPAYSSTNHGLQTSDFYATKYAQKLVSGTFTGGATKLPTKC